MRVVLDEASELRITPTPKAFYNVVFTKNKRDTAGLRCRVRLTRQVLPCGSVRGVPQTRASSSPAGRNYRAPASRADSASYSTWQWRMKTFINSVSPTQRTVTLCPADI